MATRKFFERLAERSPSHRFRGRNFGAEAPGDPLDPLDQSGTAQGEAGRAETVQRLQIGVTTLAVMLTMIALASIVGTQAKLAEEAAVPDAAPTTEPTEAPAQRDPLADAGVVPDIPNEEDEPDEPGEGGERRQIVPDTPPPGAAGGQDPGPAPGQPPGNAGPR